MRESELVDIAIQAISSLRETHGFPSDNKLAEHLGVSSAFIYHLEKRANLRPTLYRALIDQGLMDEPPPTMEIPVATAALMFSVARFPKIRRRKPGPQKKRAPRISIQKENPELAAAAILKNMDQPSVQLLIDILISKSQEDCHE